MMFILFKFIVTFLVITTNLEKFILLIKNSHLNKLTYSLYLRSLLNIYRIYFEVKFKYRKYKYVI